VKICCPFHQEDTPSCHVYHDGYHCFGCGAHGPLSDLKGRVDVKAPPKHTEPEDLGPWRQYLAKLPLRQVRGLSLPCDNRSYFIVWPGTQFFKRRFFEPGKGPKYVGPRGHQPPLFWVRREGAILVIVEGELNALSVAAALPEAAVCSPGSASNFSPAFLRKELCNTVYYTKICIIADADNPGAEAVMNAKGFFNAFGRDVQWKLMSPDANDVLVELGAETLREQLKDVLATALEARSGEGQVPA